MGQRVKCRLDNLLSTHKSGASSVSNRQYVLQYTPTLMSLLVVVQLRSEEVPCSVTHLYTYQSTRQLTQAIEESENLPYYTFFTKSKRHAITTCAKDSGSRCQGSWAEIRINHLHSAFDREMSSLANEGSAWPIAWLTTSGFTATFNTVCTDKTDMLVKRVRVFRFATYVCAYRRDVCLLALFETTSDEQVKLSSHAGPKSAVRGEHVSHDIAFGRLWHRGLRHEMLFPQPHRRLDLNIVCVPLGLARLMYGCSLYGTANFVMVLGIDWPIHSGHCDILDLTQLAAHTPGPIPDAHPITHQPFCSACSPALPLAVCAPGPGQCRDAPGRFTSKKVQRRSSKAGNSPLSAVALILDLVQSFPAPQS
ncbi:hypothetical protein F5Y18DRAFT_58985 [Xylariaceae sp. FL1019]|nr:hypothetical protein F5Y18DRAFT_58985 [Xylariaceae sp. FL1019]